ncbi:hypothetical protein ACOSQ2_030810 [Xanthoceras sorbifolium]
MNSTVIAFVFFELLVIIATFKNSFCSGSTYVGCIESEREALLRFKQDVEDTSNRLASWTADGDGDCCKWVGVVCSSNLTGHGHVHELHLRNPTEELKLAVTSMLIGKINPSLVDLKHLIYLDLSHNYFEEIQIPTFFGSMRNLRYLNLSRAGFGGRIISNQLGSLSNLQYLDLSLNTFQGPIPPSLGKLSSLKYLNLSYTNLSGSIPSSLGKLFSLINLNLSNNEVSGFIPSSLGELSSLTNLDLSNNKLSGPIPSSLGELSSLTNLDLSNNKLSGPIPLSLGGLLSLTDLYLYNNNLSGPIPSFFGELSSLELVDLSLNKLNGTLSEIHFANLTKLLVFKVQGNSLILKVNPSWIPPFQLHSLYMGSCHLGPQFPPWIYSQTNLSYLDISNSGIVDTIHSRFWKFSSQFFILNLSHNQIHGKIPNLMEAPWRASLDFSSNRFSGPLPSISSNTSRLDFSNNTLSGPIYQFLCNERNAWKGLVILNLRNNFLSGELPDCWMSWEQLEAVYLDNNKFIGNLPISMGTLTNLESLHLRGNSLSGTIPASLGNCTNFVALDIGENEFVGNVPTWIGERFSRMRILNLRSNKFHGHLPLELCHLVSLQILDLASNNLSGTIPRCFNNFSAMVTVDYLDGNQIYIYRFRDFEERISEYASLIMKGKGVEYENTLNLVRIIDLSNNNFSGEIPVQVTNLKALQSLNLSRNFFVGRIPESIGAMRSLESIDFSGNQFSGEIPQSFSELNFLSYLNLSDNNLTGKIPLSTQLQSLDASSYTGNDLCGPPLPSCPVPAVPAPDHETDDEDEHEVNWFYVSMALGFVMGFWSLISPLIVNRRWRYRYSLFLDHLLNKLCPFVK